MHIEVSVIIPTFNRRSCLERLLQSLFQQTVEPSRFEIIVVSDGSTDGTTEMVRTFMRDHSNLVFLEQKNKGPASARNNAGQAARGKYLAFTDDDCIVAHNWIQALIKVFEQTGAVAVQGRTTTDPNQCSLLTNQVENIWGMSGVPTCNAGYRKDIFDKVGGFDESFPFPHNEDADLAWRVEKLGPIPFAPEVHVIHPPRKERLLARAHWVRYLEADFLLYAKHPEVYRQRCGPSPWRTVYWRAFVMTQIGDLKESLQYLFWPFKPLSCLQGIGLVLMRGWNLLRYYPFYLRASRRYRTRDLNSSRAGGRSGLSPATAAAQEAGESLAGGTGSKPR